MRAFLLLFALISAAAQARSLDGRHELWITAKPGGTILRTQGNSELLSRKSTPASTIKIYLSLIGREEGVLKDGTTFICSDRSDQPEPYTLSRALADSSNEFFANLVAKLGVSKVRSYLERWDYPDADIPSSAKPLDVAMGQVFSVSPRQQLRMLVRFQAHELPGISEKSFEAVERAMREKEFRSLQGKTGSDHNGSWFIGFTEGRLYVLRSDVPNSQGKDLKALLIEHLRDSAPPSPPAQDRDSLTRPQD